MSQDAAAAFDHAPRHGRVGRFGCAAAGVSLLIPAGIPVEFVDAAQVWPIAFAPPRLLGLMSWHGQPIPVFDAAFEPNEPTRAPTILPVLVLTLHSGTMAESVGLRVDGAPRGLGALSPVGAAVRPRMPWAHCLIAAFDEREAPLPADPDRTSGQADRDSASPYWWDVDADRLLDWLGRPR